MKAVYAGAGTDVCFPFCNLLDVNSFYFIDSQPFSVYGTDVSLQADGSNGFSRANFMSHLEKTMDMCGLLPHLIRENIRTYMSKTASRRLIHYLINTSVPHHISKIKTQVRQYDMLIVNGFDPDRTIVDYIKHPILFVGGANCDYSADPGTYYNGDQNGVVQQLHQDQKFRQKFSQFLYVDDGGKKHTFSTWEEFCDKANGKESEADDYLYSQA